MGALKKIFILHGWAYSIDKWGSFVSLVRDQGFEPAMLNVPGLTRETDKVWALDDYVEWLAEELKTEREAIIVGHSNGGRLALAFAAKHPEKLKYLILIDSAGIYHNEFPIRLKRYLFGAAAKVGKKITRSEKLRGWLYKAVGERDYFRASPLMKQTMANLISVDLAPSLKKITTPTLIIWGEHDKATPLVDGRLMQRSIQGSRLCVIKQAGHSPQFTHPREVWQKIMEAIAKL